MEEYTKKKIGSTVLNKMSDVMTTSAVVFLLFSTLTIMLATKHILPNYIFGGSYFQVHKTNPPLSTDRVFYVSQLTTHFVGRGRGISYTQCLGSHPNRLLGSHIILIVRAVLVHIFWLLANYVLLVIQCCHNFLVISKLLACLIQIFRQQKIQTKSKQ